MAVEVRQRYYLPLNSNGEPRLSFTMGQTFFQCGECFRLKYLEDDPPPPRMDANRPWGAGWHAALAYWHRCQMSGAEVVMDELIDAALDGFRECCEGIDREGNVGPVPILTFDQGEAERFLLAFVAGTMPQVFALERDLTPLAVEADIDFTSIFPFKFKGIKDVAFDGRLREYKTAKKPRRPEADHLIQLGIYCLPDRANLPTVDICQGTKTPPYEVRLHKDPAINCDRSYEWVMNAANGISRGVFEVGPGFFGRHDYVHGVA